MEEAEIKDSFMKFEIPKNRDGMLSTMRLIGYSLHRGKGETSYSRPLSRQDYPRFHIYLKETETTFVLNLHIDQKKPTYGDFTAHSGEYEGSIIEQEAERIKLTLR